MLHEKKGSIHQKSLNNNNNNNTVKIVTLQSFYLFSQYYVHPSTSPQVLGTVVHLWRDDGGCYSELSAFGLLRREEYDVHGDGFLLLTLGFICGYFYMFSSMLLHHSFFIGLQPRVGYKFLVFGAFYIS